MNIDLTLTVPQFMNTKTIFVLPIKESISFIWLEMAYFPFW